MRRPARRRTQAHAALAIALLAVLGPATAVAQTSPIHTAPAPASVRSALAPPYTELGARVLYRGAVVGEATAKVRWLAPEPDDRFTWGTPVVRARQGWKRGQVVPAGAWYEMSDTVSIEIPLQAFVTGRLDIPGLRLEINDGSGPRLFRLPQTTLTVVPTIAANDTSADFRSAHGPIAAPWWERVPWMWVIAGALLIAAIVAFILWLRRRRKKPAAAAASPTALDPLAEALAALQALRELHLPEHGRFAEHAFRLGQILRRYLEAVTRTTRPGDTTPELIGHLRLAGLDADELARLSGLLRVWDQVKFAREPFTLDAAVKAEVAVESFLRRPPRVERQVA